MHGDLPGAEKSSSDPRGYASRDMLKMNIMMQSLPCGSLAPLDGGDELGDGEIAGIVIG